MHATGDPRHAWVSRSHSEHSPKSKSDSEKIQFSNILKSSQVCSKKETRSKNNPKYSSTSDWDSIQRDKSRKATQCFFKSMLNCSKAKRLWELITLHIHETPYKLNTNHFKNRKRIILWIVLNRNIILLIQWQLLHRCIFAKDFTNVCTLCKGTHTIGIIFSVNMFHSDQYHFCLHRHNYNLLSK